MNSGTEMSIKSKFICANIQFNEVVQQNRNFITALKDFLASLFLWIAYYIIIIYIDRLIIPPLHEMKREECNKKKRAWTNIRSDDGKYISVDVTSFPICRHIVHFLICLFRMANKLNSLLWDRIRFNVTIQHLNGEKKSSRLRNGILCT